MSEKRISKAIQRDSWSALKYALRLAQIIEREELLNEINSRKKSDWAEELKKFENGGTVGAGIAGRAMGRTVTERRGGRIY